MRTFAFAVTLLALTYVASASGKSKTITMRVTDPTTVAGVQLKPGEYQIKVADGTATFLRDGKEVVKAAVHGAAAAQKFESDEFLTDASNTLTEFHIGGTTDDEILDGPAQK